MKVGRKLFWTFPEGMMLICSHYPVNGSCVDYDKMGLRISLSSAWKRSCPSVRSRLLLAWGPFQTRANASTRLYSFRSFAVYLEVGGGGGGGLPCRGRCGLAPSGRQGAGRITLSVACAGGFKKIKISEEDVYAKKLAKE